MKPTGKYKKSQLPLINSHTINSNKSYLASPHQLRQMIEEDMKKKTDHELPKRSTFSKENPYKSNPVSPSRSNIFASNGLSSLLQHSPEKRSDNKMIFAETSRVGFKLEKKPNRLRSNISFYQGFGSSMDENQIREKVYNEINQEIASVRELEIWEKKKKSEGLIKNYRSQEYSKGGFNQDHVLTSESDLPSAKQSELPKFRVQNQKPKVKKIRFLENTIEVNFKSISAPNTPRIVNRKKIENQIRLDFQRQKHKSPAKGILRNKSSALIHD